MKLTYPHEALQLNLLHYQPDAHSNFRGILRAHNPETILVRQYEAYRKLIGSYRKLIYNIIGSYRK